MHALPAALLAGGDLEVPERHGDDPGVGEEERRDERHDELPEERLSEEEAGFTLSALELELTATLV